ncbi:sugar phosphate nucleotidyltransferase, partial [Candidatus Omnitrophota bacterium]
GDGSQLGMNIQYSYEEEPLGTGGALKNAAEKLDEEFLLLNGDTYLEADYCKIIKAFQKERGSGIIAVYGNKDGIAPNNIVVGSSNLVIEYDKKDAGGKTHLDAGVAVYKKDVIGLVHEGKVCSLEEEIFPELIKDGKLFAFPVEQRFYDMGSIEGLQLLEEVLR